MRILSQTDNGCEIAAAKYHSEVKNDAARLRFESGHEFHLCIPSVLSIVGRRDVHLGLGPIQVGQDREHLEVVVPARSSLWPRKEYHFVLEENCVSFFLRVAGQGSLDRLLLFGTLPERSGEVTMEEFSRAGRGSKGNIERLFLPQPNTQEKHHFSPKEFIRQSVDYRPDFYGGNHYFTPAPFCYGLANKGQWLGVTLAAGEGQYRFVNFDHWGGEQFCFCVDYEGYWGIDGAWESPRLIFNADPRPDEYEVLKQSCDCLYEKRWVHVPRKEVPDWWRRPIFCGWGEQCYLHHQGEFEGRPSDQTAQSYATQANYEFFLKHLESKGIDPGTIVIDDKWMLFRGHPVVDFGKWRDLRGFIERQHEQGRKVLLWFATWECDGVPEAHCVRREGKPLKVDPTHPGYIEQLERDIRRMLGSGPGDYNADGFKVDFTANIPSGPSCELYEPVWGVELLHRLIKNIHDFSKRIKPDALIMTHTAHPYFAPCIDMLRLNDIMIQQASVVPEMTHRARVARAVHPDLLIDTDNWPCPTREAWLEYIQLQPRLGVPSLYYATHIGRTELIREEDYAVVRQVWEKYKSDLRQMLP